MSSKITNRTYWVLACVWLLGGCSATELLNPGVQGGNKAEEAQFIAESSGEPAQRKFQEIDVGQASQPTSLKIEQGDKLRVTIWGYPELEHIADVQPNGSITLPLAGEVLVEGLTLEQIRGRINDKLQPFTEPSAPLLRSGDLVTMSVWQHSDLFHTAVVEPAGTITLPLVGSVDASGRPIESIRREVEERMTTFVRDVRVSILPEFTNRRILQDHYVSVLPYGLRERSVAVIGAVGVQGLQPIVGSLRLADALAKAQLDDRMAELNSIVVIRHPKSEEPQYSRLRIKDFFNGLAPEQNIYLQDEDIVIVPKTTIAQVGDFVDMFFTRTMPVFSWWMSMHAAKVADESAETVKLINESLERGLLDISPSP